MGLRPGTGHEDWGCRESQWEHGDWGRELIEQAHVVFTITRRYQDEHVVPTLQVRKLRFGEVTDLPKVPQRKSLDVNWVSRLVLAKLGEGWDSGGIVSFYPRAPGAWAAQVLELLLKWTQCRWFHPRQDSQ